MIIHMKTMLMNRHRWKIHCLHHRWTTYCQPHHHWTAHCRQLAHSRSHHPNNPNQSSSIPDAPPPHRLSNRVNRGIPKLTYEADPKCKTRYPVNRPNKESNVFYPLGNYVSTSHLSESNKSFVFQLSTVSILNSVQEALADPRWQAAMNEELKSLKKNATWEITDLPAGKKPVRCKWVYIVKYKVDGTVDHFKARLVAKWYTKKYGIDYTDTFAPYGQDQHSFCFVVLGYES